MISNVPKSPVPDHQNLTRLESISESDKSTSEVSSESDFVVPSDQDLAVYESLGNLLDIALKQPITSIESTGQKFIGTFPLIRMLGAGGCGVVYLAQDPLLKRHVAIKVPHLSMLLFKDKRDRFLQEAKIVAKLQHTNIVEIFQIGAEHESYFLVFEYCAGGSLAEWLEQQSSPADPRVSAKIIQALATAVEYAHQQQVAHRDINPRNILLVPVPDGAANETASQFPFIPKLSDFGLGTWLDDRLTAVQTQIGTLLGTVPYMAPEQLRRSNGPISCSIDVYALGILLYELLTLKRPFTADSQADLIQFILNREPVSPRQMNRAVSRDLETICLRCLQKSPTDRYASAAELVDDLGRYLAGNPIHARRVGVVEKSIRWIAKRRVQVGTAALVVSLLAIIGFGGAWIFNELKVAQQAEEKLKQISGDQESKLSIAAINDLQLKRELKERTRRQDYNSQIEAIGNIVHTHSFDVIQRLREWIPKTKAETDYRGFEWYYLMQAAGGDVVAMMTAAHGTEILALKASENSQRVHIATGKTLTEWDYQSGKPLRVLVESERNIRDFAISEETNRLGVIHFESGNVDIFELTSERSKLLRTTSWLSVIPKCNRLYFSPDHSQLLTICSQDHNFRKQSRVLIHAVNTDAEVQRHLGHTSHYFDLVIDAGQDHIISTADDAIDIRTRQGIDFQTLPITTDQSFVTSLAISTDSKTLAASTQTRLISLCRKDPKNQWYIAGTLPIQRIVPPDDFARYMFNRNPVRFGRDPRRLYAGFSREVSYWNIENLTNLQAVIELPGNVRHLERLADQQSIAWATEKVVGIWRPVEPIPQIKGHSTETWSVSFSPDGKLLATGSDDNLIRVWDVATGVMKRELMGHTATVATVAFSPDGKLLASGSLDGTARIWDVALGHSSKALPPMNGSIRALAWFRDGKRLLIGHSTGTERPQRLIVANVSKGEAERTIETFKERIHHVLVGADHRNIVAVSNDRSIQIWNSELGTPVRQWTASSHLRTAAFLNHETQLATGSNDGTIRVWNLSTGDLIQEMIGHTAAVLTLAASPDGRILASGGEDKTVRLWDPVTGRCVLTFRDHTTQINNVQFSPDGTILACAAHDGSVVLKYAPRITPLLSPTAN